MVVSSEEFERTKHRNLTWFTACDNFGNVIQTECINCELCLAGIENARLYYDKQFKVFILIRRSNQSRHRFRIDINLITGVLF